MVTNGSGEGRILPAKGEPEQMTGEARKPGTPKKVMSAKRLRKLLNIFPPFVGAAVHVKSVSDDFRTIEVEMPMRFWNKNLVGTHFGGSLYSMTDPFYMIMLIHHLGPGYIVWDKSATIRFKSPGIGLMRATFHMTAERVDEIRSQADREEKVEPVFQVIVKNSKGEVVAEVDKLLWVKKRKGKG
jgi:hypothetical protein